MNQPATNKLRLQSRQSSGHGHACSRGSRPERKGECHSPTLGVSKVEAHSGPKRPHWQREISREGISKHIALAGDVLHPQAQVPLHTYKKDLH
jgi:hypothetical protein